MQGLKVAVVVMGILIVAGLALLGVTLAGRLSTSSAALANMVLDEPAGTTIAATALAPDRLALQLRGGGPDRTVLIDTKSGRILGRVALAR